MSRVVTGLALVALGVLFLLDAVDVLSAGPLIGDWWPTVIIAIGLAQLADRTSDRGGALTTIVIGAVLLAITTDVLNADTWQTLWPVAIILVGLWIMFGRKSRRPARAFDQDEVDEFVLFSGKELHIAGNAFRGGRVAAAFGGIDLDLRLARLHPEGAVLQTVALFGGVDVKVPRGWRVRVSGPAIFGAWEDQSLPAPEGAPLLIVKATVAFGGVTVKADPAVEAIDAQAEAPTGTAG
jgi:predicted membrane protein